MSDSQHDDTRSTPARRRPPRSTRRRPGGRTQSGGPSASARPRTTALDPQTIIHLADYHRARRGFASDSALAAVFPVNRSRISRWKRGEAPDPDNARLLRDVATVVARLADYYEAESIPKWLQGRNPELGGRRPIDVIRAGELPGVLSAIAAQTSGAFF